MVIFVHVCISIKIMMLISGWWMFLATDISSSMLNLSLGTFCVIPPVISPQFLKLDTCVRHGVIKHDHNSSSFHCTSGLYLHHFKLSITTSITISFSIFYLQHPVLGRDYTQWDTSLQWLIHLPFKNSVVHASISRGGMAHHGSRGESF